VIATIIAIFMELSMTISDYGKAFIGVEYKWGGKTVESGFDCSGFVSECLKSAGSLENKKLLNSQGLYNHLVGDGISSAIMEDSLLFFGESVNSISHVAIAINDFQMIEAGGEGRLDTDAGWVRIRPISMRGDLVGVIYLYPHSI